MASASVRFWPGTLEALNTVAAHRRLWMMKPMQIGDWLQALDCVEIMHWRANAEMTIMNARN